MQLICVTDKYCSEVKCGTAEATSQLSFNQPVYTAALNVNIVGYGTARCINGPEKHKNPGAWDGLLFNMWMCSKDSGSANIPQEENCSCARCVADLSPPRVTILMWWRS